MNRLIPMVFIVVGLLIVGLSLGTPVSAAPAIEFLGEGGSFTIEPGRHFIVKRTGPFNFFTRPGPTYDAAPGERVWASTMGAPAPHVRVTLDYGHVPEGCKISYTAIDDDVDDRINIFYLDGEAIHDMPQGMVTGGEFFTPGEGKLTLRAIDSIGLWLNRCQSPTSTPTAENTATATPEPSNTPGPSPTSTATRKPIPSPEPSSTPEVPEPTQTAAPPTSTPSPSPVPATATATKKPRLPACLRINFEMSGDEAREGIYEVREAGGRLLYTWYAQEGWQDSGWIYGIDISFENVYIEVFYVPEDGPPIKMDIMNPTPGTEYAWLSRGKCHALEIGWPDETITPTPTPDVNDGFNDEFDAEALDRQRFIWPEIQPTATETPASSLSG